MAEPTPPTTETPDDAVLQWRASQDAELARIMAAKFGGTAPPAGPAPVLPEGAESDIPAMHVTGPKGTTAEDVQKTGRDVRGRALKHAELTATGAEPRDETFARGGGMAEDILGRTPPPDPNTSVGEAVTRAIYGNEYPLLDKLPASEKALLAAELLNPLPGRGLEAVRTGDVAGSLERTAGDVSELARLSVAPLLAGVDVMAGTKLAPDIEELATEHVRIGDDVVAVESPAMRLMRLVGTPLQAAVTYPAHQSLKHVTPRQAVDVLTLWGGPVAWATSIKSPAEMLTEDPEFARSAGNVATLYGGPQAWVDALKAGNLPESTVGGNLAEAMARNPDQPFITDAAEVAERGEQPWNASEGWLPQVVADPLVGYLQDISRGRGTTPIFAEMARSQGFDPGTPEYSAMSSAGLVAEFLPVDAAPIAALSKMTALVKAAGAGRKIDQAVSGAPVAIAVEAVLQELFAKGGAVDAVRPAADAFRLELRNGNGPRAWAKYKAADPDGADVIQRIYRDAHGESIDDAFARMASTTTTMPPPGAGGAGTTPTPTPTGPGPTTTATAGTGPVTTPIGGPPTAVTDPFIISPIGAEHVPGPGEAPTVSDQVDLGLPIGERPTTAIPDVDGDAPTSFEGRDLARPFDPSGDLAPEMGARFESVEAPAPTPPPGTVAVPPDWFEAWSPVQKQAMKAPVDTQAKTEAYTRGQTAVPVEVEYTPTTDDVIDGPMWRATSDGDRAFVLVDDADRTVIEPVIREYPEGHTRRPIPAQEPAPVPAPGPQSNAGAVPHVGEAWVDLVNNGYDEVQPDDVAAMLAFEEATTEPGVPRSRSWPDRAPTPTATPPVDPGVWTPEQVASFETYLREPGLDHHLSAMASSDDPVAQAATKAWVQEQRLRAATLPRPDLQAAMHAALDLADASTPITKRFESLMRLVGFRGGAIPNIPILDIEDAVRAGRVTEADAARAVGLGATTAGRTANGASDELRATRQAWQRHGATSLKQMAAADFKRKVESLVDLGKDFPATYAADLASAQERIKSLSVMERGNLGAHLTPEEAVAYVTSEARNEHRKMRQRMVRGGRAHAVPAVRDVVLPFADSILNPDMRVRAEARAKLRAMEKGPSAMTYQKRPENTSAFSDVVTRPRPTDKPPAVSVAAVQAAAGGDVVKAVDLPAPPPVVDRPSTSGSVAAALGWSPSGRPGGASLPVSPRQAVIDAVGNGVAAKPWDEARARKSPYGHVSGAYDPQAMMLEELPHMDGKKYVLVTPGKKPGAKRFKLNGFDPDDALAGIAGRKSKHRVPNARIEVFGSRRPIAEWKLGPTGKYELVPHYGASPEEAQVVKDFARVPGKGTIRRGELDLDEVIAWEQAQPKELRMNIGPPDLGGLITRIASSWTGPGPRPGLSADLEGIAVAVEEGMRSSMRGRMGSSHLVPIVGNVVVTPVERTRILAKMRDELRPLYDTDAYYRKGGLKLDAYGNLPFNKQQRREFWLLNEKYGGNPPETYGEVLQDAVTPEMTRALHHRMAREMAGRGAWMELAMKDMSPWATVAIKALNLVNKPAEEMYLKTGGKVAQSAVHGLFDTYAPVMRKRAPEAAAALDRWVHSLSMVAVETARKVDEARHGGMDQVDAMRHVLGDSFKPLTPTTNGYVDIGLTPGVSKATLETVGQHALDYDEAILSPDLLRMRARITQHADGLAEFGAAWAKRRADDRRIYGRMWLDAVAPGLAPPQIEGVLRELGGGDKALDRLYHDAFVSPDPKAWGQTQHRYWKGGPKDVVRQGLAEWWRGGGKMTYLSDEGTLGKALERHSPGWTPPTEDETVFNFMVRLRSEAVAKEAVRDLVYHGAGMQASRFADLVHDMLAHPDALRPQWAVDRGYHPTDVIEAHRVIEKLGLSVGDKSALVSAGDDVLTTPYIATAIKEAQAYGVSDSSAITGNKWFDDAMRYYKTNALGLMGFLASPSYFVANSMSAVLQAYLVRGGTAVSDLFGTAMDPAAWGIAADLAEMRSRKWSFGTRNLASQARKNTYVFPTGAYSHDELVAGLRARGVDAQAARAENAAALIDDTRRHDYSTFRRLIAFDDHIQYANEVQNMADMQFRTRIALGELKRGATLDEACLAAREALYDYSGLQPFERKWMRALFPWYTFTKRNSEALIKSLVFHPERVSYLTRLAYKQPELWGYSEEQKTLLRDNQWGQVILGEQEGKDLDHDARFITTSSVNPADGLLWMQAHLGMGEGTAAEAWLGDTYPHIQQFVGEAVNLAPGRNIGIDVDKANEVPDYWMADPHMAAWLKQSFGVAAAPLSKTDTRPPTTYDEVGRPMRWVVGKQADLDGQPMLAAGQRTAWRAVTAYLGKTPNQMRLYNEILHPAARRPGTTTGGLMAEAIAGKSRERLSQDASMETLRDRENRAVSDEAERVFGPANPQGPGVGIYNEAMPE